MAKNGLKEKVKSIVSATLAESKEFEKLVAEIATERLALKKKELERQVRDEVDEALDNVLEEGGLLSGLFGTK